MKLRERLQQKQGLIAGMIAGAMANGQICLASMPWESPLQTIQSSVTGPVATAVCTIIVVITGVAISCGEGGGAGRKLLQAVCGLSLALAAAGFISNFSS